MVKSIKYQVDVEIEQIEEDKETERFRVIQKIYFPQTQHTRTIRRIEGTHAECEAYRQKLVAYLKGQAEMHPADI